MYTLTEVSRTRRLPRADKPASFYQKIKPMKWWLQNTLGGTPQVSDVGSAC